LHGRLPPKWPAIKCGAAHPPGFWRFTSSIAANIAKLPELLR
jgi:hypothetical protein